MKSIIVTALSLFLICAVAAGVLAGVNAVTAPTIAANAAAAADKARGEVVPEADGFTEQTAPDGTVYYAAEKGGDTTPSLRKAVVSKLIEAYRQVNAAARIVPMPEIEQAIQDVCGIIEHYKLVASEAKHRKGDEPEPGPEPEPNGGAAAS